MYRTNVIEKVCRQEALFKLIGLEHSDVEAVLNVFYFL